VCGVCVCVVCGVWFVRVWVCVCVGVCVVCVGVWFVCVYVSVVCVCVWFAWCVCVCVQMLGTVGLIRTSLN